MFRGMNLAVLPIRAMALFLRALDGPRPPRISAPNSFRAEFWVYVHKIDSDCHPNVRQDARYGIFVG